MAIGVCTIAVLTVHGCAYSRTQTGAPCARDSDCPADQACLRLHPSELGDARCALVCPAAPSLCDDGSVCEPLYADDPRTSWACWSGGDLEPGRSCRTDFECARGLRCGWDGAAVVAPYCVYGCSTTDDCPRGYYCHSTTTIDRACMLRCQIGDPAPTGHVCIAGVWMDLASAQECGTVEGTCPVDEGCDRSRMAPHRCAPYAEIGCFATGCPDGEVCFETCVPRHE